MLRLFYFILILGTFVLFTSTEKQSSVRHNVTFGVKIGIMPTGSLVQLAIFHYRGGKAASVQPISKTEFFKIGSGQWPLPKSRAAHDFFEEQGLNDLHKYDSLAEPPIDINAALDSLWKIRYQEHPFKAKLGKGWSNGRFRPSNKQQAYIYNTYGVRGYDQDYFSDTAFFQLMRDVVNPEWITNYKSLRDE
jgi:hypothetical protein